MASSDRYTNGPKRGAQRGKEQTIEQSSLEQSIEKFLRFRAGPHFGVSALELLTVRPVGSGFPRQSGEAMPAPSSLASPFFCGPKNIGGGKCSFDLFALLEHRSHLRPNFARSGQGGLEAAAKAGAAGTQGCQVCLLRWILLLFSKSVEQNIADDLSLLDILIIGPCPRADQ